MSKRALLPIEKLQQEILRRFPSAEVSLDRPCGSADAWFLDVRLDGHAVVVQWQQRKGFGVSSSEEYGYGDGPDEVYETEEAAYGRILSLLLSKVRTAPPGLVGLRGLRKETGLSQAELAEILNKQQGEISKIERRKDFLISTLTDYVRAVGGELQLSVRLGDGTLRRLQFDESVEPQ